MRVLSLLIFLCGLGFVSTLVEAMELRLNHLQTIGSHNSYKASLPTISKSFLLTKDAKKALALSYSHPSLTRQLELGLRHLELDVVKDPIGNRFSRPFLEAITGRTMLSNSQRASLAKPGFKVLHIPDIDVDSHCMTFVNCLEQLVAWSDLNPEHLPVFVMLNVKETGSRHLPESSTIVSPFDAKDYKGLDRDIRTIIADKLLTPDAVRGDLPTLKQAVLEHGWPLLSETLGKFLVFFDGNSEQRQRYLAQHQGLIGRAMFTMTPPDADGAAIFIINDPVNNYQQIQQLVAKGFIVRTRSDASMADGILANQQRVDAAFSSGAQIISSDFYLGSPQANRFGFAVSFDQQFTRCFDTRFSTYRDCKHLFTPSNTKDN